jgi:hypothetical protein
MKVEQISENSFDCALDVIASALYDQVSPYDQDQLVEILTRIIQTLEKK